MGTVLLVWLLPGDPVMLLTLLVALYLTYLELRGLRPQPRFRWRAWWFSFVLLTHFIGYLLLRAYTAYRRAQQARA